MGWSTRNPASRLAVFFVAHFGAVELGRAFYFDEQDCATFWPASGLLLGVLLLAPTGRWWQLLVVATAAQFASDVAVHGTSITTSLATGGGNALESLVGAYLMSRLFGTPLQISKVRVATAFIVIAGMAATTLSAFVGAMVVTSSESYLSAWQVWWFSDALGVLVIAPAVVVWGNAGFPRLRPTDQGWALELIAVFLGLILTAQLVFGAEPAPARSILDFPYVVVPFMIWTGMRFQLRAVTLIMLPIAFIAVANTELGRGPFATAGATVREHVLAIQAFLAVITVSGLIFSGIVTERRRATQALRKSRELQERRTTELVQLTARLHTVREEERALLSREIHDEIGQALTGLKLELSWLRKELPDGEERVDGMTQLIDKTLNDARRMSARLRPSVLDDLGLAAAIESCARDIAERAGLECDLELEETTSLDDDRNIAVFRIAQEALTNVARHAQASRVRVRLESRDGAIALQVIDDGCGIDAGAGRGSLGLVGMRERAAALGGRLEIGVADGGGTRVHLRVPA